MHIAFSILQNDMENVVKKSTQIWKLIYGLTTVTKGEEDPFEGKKNGDEEEYKEDEIEKDNTNVEETQKKIDEWLQLKSSRKNRVFKTHRCRA